MDISKKGKRRRFTRRLGVWDGFERMGWRDGRVEVVCWRREREGGGRGRVSK